MVFVLVFILYLCYYMYKMKIEKIEKITITKLSETKWRVYVVEENIMCFMDFEDLGYILKEGLINKIETIKGE